jgi:hypothetical protein
VKYWEIIADNLSKAGWSWGCVSAIDSSGRTFWIADAHRDDGNRFVVRADERLTAFVELQSVIHESFQSSNLRLPSERTGLARQQKREKSEFAVAGQTHAGRISAWTSTSLSS